MPAGLSAQKLDELEQLVRRYCAVDGATGELAPGYFAFYAGRSASAARSRDTVAPVEWSDDATGIYDLVLRRVRMLVGAGVGPYIYVRAYERGQSNPTEWVVVEGERDDEIGARLESGELVGAEALWAAHAHVVATVVRSNRDLLEANSSIVHERQEAMVQAALALLHSQHLEEADSGRAIASAIEAAAPIVDAALPTIAAALQGRSPTQRRPREPERAVIWHLAQIREQAPGLMAALRQDPRLLAHPTVHAQIDELSRAVTTLRAMLLPLDHDLDEAPVVHDGIGED